MIRTGPKLASRLAVTCLVCAASAARAERFDPPFTRTLSNTRPLAFGMSASDAAYALGIPLTYVRGRPGQELFMVYRENGGSGFFPRRDPLYLQFRNGALTGWKGSWGRRWVAP